MKRKRAPAGHHRNEWVFIHSLGHACIISSIAVRPWPWCRQWRPCQHLGHWWAPFIGVPFSPCSWTQHALKTWSIATQHFLCALFFPAIRHRSGPRALLCWWQEESGLRPLLQIQKEAELQAAPFHHFQWKLQHTDAGAVGDGSRVRGGQPTRSRRGGLEADRGGKGFDEGGVRSWPAWGWSADWTRQRGALRLCASHTPRAHGNRPFWVGAIFKWCDPKSCDLNGCQTGWG